MIPVLQLKKLRHREDEASQLVHGGARIRMLPVPALLTTGQESYPYA